MISALTIDLIDLKEVMIILREKYSMTFLKNPISTPYKVHFSVTKKKEILESLSINPMIIEKWVLQF